MLHSSQTSEQIVRDEQKIGDILTYLNNTIINIYNNEVTRLKEQSQNYQILTNNSAGIAVDESMTEITREVDYRLNNVVGNSNYNETEELPAAIFSSYFNDSPTYNPTLFSPPFSTQSDTELNLELELGFL